MPRPTRKELIRTVEALRPGRTLVVFFNFDRPSVPAMPGLMAQFHSDVKEPLFRVLKEAARCSNPLKIDFCLYTRGGDTNSVWPIVSLLREFDPNFEVLAPFRCHSAGTLVALGAKRIVLTPLSELSPIDPSTGNQFNPRDDIEKGKRLSISVEDVNAYRSFVKDHLGLSAESASAEAVKPFLARLADAVHPLALGNVHRVHQQIKRLARSLLSLHGTQKPTEEIIKALTTEFYSHLHMINREEAKFILGDDKVVFADSELANALDALLYYYEHDFKLRETFFLLHHMEDMPEKHESFLAGVVESGLWSYVYETKARLTQVSVLPPNVQVQIPAGQPMPLIRGLPRECQVEAFSQGWVRADPPKEASDVH